MAYPVLPSAVRPVPHSEDLLVPKPLIFNNDNSGYDECRGQQEGDNVDFDPTSEASCSTSEPHLLSER